MNAIYILEIGQCLVEYEYICNWCALENVEWKTFVVLSKIIGENKMLTFVLYCISVCKNIIRCIFFLMKFVTCIIIIGKKFLS